MRKKNSVELIVHCSVVFVALSCLWPIQVFSCATVQGLCCHILSLIIQEPLQYWNSTGQNELRLNSEICMCLDIDALCCMSTLESHLFVCECVYVLMVRAEEHVSQNGIPFTHSHIFIQQSRLVNRVHQDLKHKRQFLWVSNSTETLLTDKTREVHFLKETRNGCAAVTMEFYRRNEGWKKYL